MNLGPIYPALVLIVLAVLAVNGTISGGEFLAALGGGAVALPVTIRKGSPQ